MRRKTPFGITIWYAMLVGLVPWACSPPAVTGSSPSPSPAAVVPTVQVVRSLKSVVRQAPPKSILPLLKELIKTAPGPVAIGFVDLESGLRAEHHPHDVFESASLVKLPVLVELYRRADEGGLKLSEEMVLEERFRVGGSGKLRNAGNGTRWSLQQLAQLMIAESDNIATDMLLERLKLDSLGPAMERLGLTDTTIERTIFDFGAIDRGRDNRTSAADTTLLLEKIGRGELPGSTAMHEILLKTRRRDMLAARLPQGARVAHKTGELTGVLHDAGIVSTPEGRRFVLVLLSQGFADREAMLAYWARLAERIYREYDRPTS